MTFPAICSINRTTMLQLLKASMSTYLSLTTFVTAHTTLIYLGTNLQVTQK